MNEESVFLAFYPSPFYEAIILTADGVGEWATTTVAIGKNNNLDIKKEIHFPHSLGLLYSAFTYFTGFKVNSGEYKLMGLAPYGDPKYVDIIFDNLIQVRDDGSYRLNMDYFAFATELRMTNDRCEDLFDGPARKPESEITQREMDLAASVQKVLEEVVLRISRTIHEETGLDNLCLAGGVALNCVANGRLLREGYFKDIWIQPAAGDAGGALGAAYAAWHGYCDQERKVNKQDSMQGSFLGIGFSESDVEAYLKEQEIPHRKLKETDVSSEVADLLVDGKVVGWFQGRMEFGPRALGARSILGDARSPNMQKTLNLKVKYRESFRPFAPSVLSEDISDWFELAYDSPYMLLVDNVNKDKRIKMTVEEESLFGIDKLNIKRSSIPAVTHVDYSARIQTVHKETNPKFHALITKFKEKTGCSVVVNTSFNVRGEPIVCTPEDAFHCFMGADNRFAAHIE
jgi:carbamoyltransferase